MKKLGYLVPEFPGQTHAFFWREAIALEETGVSLQFLSTRKPALDACPHAFGDAARTRTHYLFPPSAKVLGTLAARPIALLRAARYVAGLSETSLKGRARLMAFLPVAAELLKTCLREKLEHVHIHSCADAAHLGALLKILGGPSYSLTLHGDLPVYGTDHGAKFAQASFVSAVTRPLADQITGVSPNTLNPVVWMGVDCDEFSPTSSTREPDAPLHVVTVARLNRTKGHVYTLEAIATLVAEGHDIRYKVIGSGPEETAIKADIARLGLQDKVEMTGALDQSDVRQALAEADVLTLTSFGFGEAAPVTVMEAMASGLPVIVSRIGGTPDMIADGIDGDLTPQEDAKAIAEALRRHATGTDHAKKIGEAARKTALEKFDFRVNARKLQDALENKVNRGGPRF